MPSNTVNVPQQYRNKSEESFCTQAMCASESRNTIQQCPFNVTFSDVQRDSAARTVRCLNCPRLLYRTTAGRLVDIWSEY